MDHVDCDDNGQVMLLMMMMMINQVVDGDDDGQGHVYDDYDGHGRVDGDDVYGEVLQVDNLDPSQCFASTDTWSDPCQQKEPVCP